MRTPPNQSYDSGQRFIVGQNATGGFAGYDNAIATYIDQQWQFFSPQTGWLCWVKAMSAEYIFDGSTWQNYSDFHFASVPVLGINAEADIQNRLSISSEASPFNHNEPIIE